MTARIDDVARAAGVSTATVSRALRGLPSVSEHTRLAVVHAATSLGYVVSRSASNLASGHTLAVAVIAPYMERWFFAQAVSAIESELRERGFDALLIGLTQPEEGGRRPFDARALRGRVDGVVVLTVPLTGRELDDVRGLGLPTVYVGATIPGAMSVRIDDYSLARLATQHLLELGHTRIAYVGGDPLQPLNFTAPADRRAGWMSTMRDAGVDPDPRWDVPGRFTAAGGLRAGLQLLDLAEPPTAVFCASDEMAFGVLAAARQRRVSVPAALSVLGVDGHELGELVGLTTIVQPVEQQGELAARMVLEALQSGRSREQEHVVLPVHLALRDSTATLRH
jgi:LacI family repressor for deo operon, udp, cdd, tsx, nupC, and nupG